MDKESSFYMEQILGTTTSKICNGSMESSSLLSSSFFKDHTNDTDANSTAVRSTTPAKSMPASTPRRRQQHSTPRNSSLKRQVTSLIRVLTKENDDIPSCVFPKLPPTTSAATTTTTSSFLFDSNASIDEVLQSPEQTLYNQTTKSTENFNNKDNTTGLIVVKPQAIGKQVRPHVTLETARLVSQVARTGMEDWLRQYDSFHSVEWGTCEALLETAAMARTKTTTKDNKSVVVISLGKSNVQLLQQWIQKAYSSIMKTSEDDEDDDDDDGIVVTLSLVEIIDKELVDLLTKGDADAALRVHHPDQHGAVVLNLTQSLVDSVDTCQYLLRQALSTSNKKSSNSGGIIIATLTVWDSVLDQQLNRLSKCHYLQFVHLPSSQTSSEEVTRSIIALRQSLSSLGAILRQIVSSSSSQLLSFRECLLTKILQRSLEPTSTHIVVLGTIAPEADAHEHTCHTLNYIQQLMGKTTTATSPFDNCTPEMTRDEQRTHDDLTRHPAFLGSYVSDPRQRIAELEKRLKSPLPSTPTKDLTPPLSGDIYYRPTNYMDLDPFDFQSQYYPEEKKAEGIGISPIQPFASPQNILRNAEKKILYQELKDMSSSIQDEANDVGEEKKVSEELEDISSLQDDSFMLQSPLPMQQQRRNDADDKTSSFDYDPKPHSPLFGGDPNSRSDFAGDDGVNLKPPSNDTLTYSSQEDWRNSSFPGESQYHGGGHKHLYPPDEHESPKKEDEGPSFAEQYPEIEREAQKLERLLQSPLEGYIKNDDSPIAMNVSTPRESLESQQPDWFEEDDVSVEEEKEPIKESPRPWGEAMEKSQHSLESTLSFQSTQEKLKDEPVLRTDLQPVRGRPSPRRMDSKISLFTTETDEAGGPFVTTPTVPSSVKVIPAPTPARSAPRQRRNSSRKSPRQRGRRHSNSPSPLLPFGKSVPVDMCSGSGNDDEDGLAYDFYQLEQAVEETKNIGSMSWQERTKSLERLRRHIVRQRSTNHKTVDELNDVERQLRDAEVEYKEQLEQLASEAGQARLEQERLQKKLQEALEEKSSFEGVAEQAVSSMEKNQEELDSLRAALQKSKLESQGQQQKYKTVLEMKERLVEELKEIRNEKSSLSIDKSEKESRLLDLELKIEQLVAERDRLKEQRDRDRLEMQELRLEIDELRLESDDIVGVNTRLEAKQEEIDRLKRSNDELSQRIHEQKRRLSEQMEATEAEIDSLTMRTQTLESELSSSRRRLEVEKEDQLRFRKDIEEEQSALRDKVKQLELERDHLQALRDTNMSELETLKLESALRADLEKRLRAAGAEVDRLRIERNKAHDAIADVRTEAAAIADEKDNDIQQLKLELHQAKIEFTSLKRRLNELDGENERIQNLAEEERERNAVKLSIMNDELARVRAELAESVRSRHTSANQAAELKVAVKSRDEANAAMKAALERLKSEQVASKRDNKQLRENLYQLREHLRTQVTGIAQEKRETDLKLEAEREKNAALQAENVHLKDWVERIRREKEVDRDGLDSFQEDMNKLMKEKSVAMTEKALLEKQLKESLLKVEDLQHELELSKLRSNEDLLNKAKGEYRAVQASNAQLTEAIENTTAERDAVKLDLEVLRQQIEKIQQAKGAAETRAARAEILMEQNKGIIEDLQHKLEIAHMQANGDLLKKAREENRAHQRTEAELRMQLEQATIERDDYQQMLDDRSSELQKLAGSKKELEDHVSALVGKLRITEHNTGELQQESQVSRQKQDELQRQLHVMKRKSEAVHLELERCRKTLAEAHLELDMIKKEREELRLQLKTELRRNQEISQKLLLTSRSEENLNEKIVVVMAEREEYVKLLHVTTSEKEELSERLKLATDKEEKLVEQLEVSTRERERLRSQLETATLEAKELGKQLFVEVEGRQKLDQQLKVASSSKEDLIREISAVTRSKEELSNELKIAARHEEDLSQQLRMASRSIEQLMQRDEKSSQTVEELTQQLDLKSRNIEDLTRQLKQATRNRDEFSQQLQEASRSAEKFNHRLETATRNEEELSLQLATVTRNREELRRELEAVMQSKEELHRELEATKQLQEESERIRDGRDRDDSELRRMREEIGRLSLEQQQQHRGTSEAERAMEREIESLREQLAVRNGVSLEEFRAEQERYEEARQLITTLANRSKASMEQRDRRIRQLNLSLIQVSEQKEAEIQALRARLHDWERSLVHDDDEDFGRSWRAGRH